MAAKSVDNSRPCELDVSHSGSPSDRNEAPALPIRSKRQVFYVAADHRIGAFDQLFGGHHHGNPSSSS
jgi:hypothetical protein